MQQSAGDLWSWRFPGLPRKPGYDARGGCPLRTTFSIPSGATVGRANRKIESETFNMLKTKGYDFEHKFGRGKRHLATVLAILTPLTFARHSVRDRETGHGGPSRANG